MEPMEGSGGGSMSPARVKQEPARAGAPHGSHSAARGIEVTVKMEPMEGSGGGGMSPARGGEEPDVLTDCVFIKEEVDLEEEEECVKEEPDCEDSAGSCGVSEAAALAGLYIDHVVKDELVLGPERPHRPDQGLRVIDWALADADGRPLSDCASTDEGRQPAPRDTSTHAHTHSDMDEEYSKHDYAKEPVCDVCGKRFDLKSDLMKHVMVHIHMPTSEQASRDGVAGNGVKKGSGSVDREEWVKTEPSWSDCAGSCGVSEAADSDHVVKDELVLGPERPHRPDQGLLVRGAQTYSRSSFGRCSVRLERLLLDAERRTCRVGRREYTLHASEPAPSTPLYQCHHCGKRFTRKTVLKKHVHAHESSAPSRNSTPAGSDPARRQTLLADDKPFQCGHCSYKCRRKYSLRIHQLLHTGEKPFECSRCDYKCRTKSNLWKHEMIHTGEKPFECSHCDYKCKLKSHLRRHVLIHTGEKPFECSQCDYKGRSKEQLRTHEFIHTGKKPFECSHCDYKGRSKEQLRTHELIHTGKKPFECSHCDYACRLKTLLRRHELIHTGKKPFECSHCDYACRLKTLLRRHEFIHTGKKPFECSQCDYKGRSKGHLKTHEFIHTGKKPFECSQCDYKGRSKGNLRRHEFIHTGERPYVCSHCDYKTIHKSNLNKHLLIHKILPSV